MNYPWLVLGVLGTAALTGGVARVTRQYGIAAIAGSAVILLLHSTLYFHYTSDDAYISYRYARNLSDGMGLVWNPGQHVEGYSNFLWVWLLAGLSFAGDDIVLSGRWLGFTLAVTAAGGTYLLTTRLIEGEAGQLAGLFATLLLASSGAWALWASAGLESPLFATLVLAAVILHLREREHVLMPASGMVWAVVSMTRPDGVLLFAVSGVFKIGESALRVRRADAAIVPALREVASMTLWLAGFAIIFGPYFGWRYMTYGWFFPNTYYAKVGAGFDQWDRGGRYLLSFLQESGGWLLLLAPLAIAMTAIRRTAVLYVFALLLTWLAYVTYIGGDSLLRFRFFASVMPLFYVVTAVSIAALIDAVHIETARRRWVPQVAIAFACAGAILFTLQPSSSDSDRISGERQAVNDRATIGRWLRGHVPATTVVAAVPVGAIAYESHLPVIDMLGINDEHIAHRGVDLGKFPAGHEKYDSEYVLDRRPDIIILFDGLSSSPWTSLDYATLNNVFIPAVIDMLGNQRLAREYERRAVQVQEGKWLNVYVRRGAAPVLATTEAAPP